MYEDDPGLLPLGKGVDSEVPRYPTQNIQTPVAIMYGGRDSLPDIAYILSSIPEPRLALCIEGIFIT